MQTNKLTAIPEDGVIIIDGEALFFAYASPLPGVKAMQWSANSGQLEYYDVAQNKTFGPDKYDNYVAPFAALWDAEKARREEEANRPPTLPEARAAALAALREKRKSIEYGGFLFQDQLWDSTEKDELRLNSILKAFEMTGLAAFPGWKIAEGVYITLTPELAQGAAIALMGHYAAAFAVEASKAGEIAALDSAEAVQAWLADELDKGW